MDIERFRTFCLSKKGVTESFPFDDKVLVFKVMNKMFALTNVDAYESINLKCDPERAIELRANYDSIRPGYHMNKQHWNSVYLNSGIPPSLLEELINHSYELIVSKLTKKQKDELRAKEGK